MDKQLIGQVTSEEKKEIQSLFERRNGLNELAKIVTAGNSDLYEKLVNDLGETTTKFEQWWTRMAEKYQWPAEDDAHWEIDFEEGKIYLVKGGKA